ncbi:MAG: YciI family protein [Acidobacteriota bacterium]
MAQFLLLLPHEPTRYRDVPHDEMMAIIQDYVAWVEDQTERGAYVDGHKLVDSAGKLLVAGDDGAEVHDGPFAELAEVLGGMMVIEAKSLDAAVDIARDHPHLRHNRRIEIRQIDAM